MNVLSLFDGMSCGQIALDQLGIKVDNYFAAEIDKWAIQVTKKNYPNTIHLGDVTQIKGEDLPQIDLLMGGSPCQGFSFAGKQLNFDDPRSALFFEFVRLLKETKPKYFLLENVRMKQEYQDVISEHLGVKPIMINSALVSAQNRVRLYWTNIPNIEQPEDKNIMIKDILESRVDKQYYAGEKLLKKYSGGNQLNPNYKSQANTIHHNKVATHCAGTHGYANGYVEGRPCELKEFNQDSTCHHIATATDIKGNESVKRVYADSGKSPTLTTCGGGHREPKVLIIPEQVKVRKHKVDIPKLQTLLKEHRKPARQISETLNVKKTTVEHWFRTDKCFSIPDADIWFALKEYLGIETNEFDAVITEFEIRDGKYDMANRVYNPEYKSPTVVASNVSKVLIVKEATKKGYTEIQDGDCFDATFLNSKTRRGRNMKDKCNCLTAANYDYMRYEHPTYRKLTPMECERLQTVPDGYTEGVSNTQRYKMLGNGWTVDVISHILKNI